MIRYDKTVWENDKTPVNAQHLGKVEDGLEYLFDVVKDVPAGEDARISNEKQRQVNETTRQNNELKRNDTLNAKVKEVDNAIVASNNNIKEINNKFETIVASKQQDAEVILARGKYPSLPTRLDNLDKDLLNVKDTAIIPVVTESNFVTVEETVNGYLKDIKLEGKTLVVNSQNEEVLPGSGGATLKSVGDGTDEILVTSVNSNIYNNGIRKGIYYSSGIYSQSEDNICNIEPLKVSPGQTIYFNNINGDRLTSNRVVELDSSKQVIKVSNEVAKLELTQNTHYINVCNMSSFTNNPNFNFSVSYNKLSEFINHKQDTKALLYYDTESQTWKKPILREWDSVEKHLDGKYYYHRRAHEFLVNKENITLVADVYASGTKNNAYYLAANDMIRSGNYIDAIICDKLRTINGYYGDDEVGISGYGVPLPTHEGKNWIYFKLPKDVSTVEQAKDFINGFKIVYKLSKEEVYECTPIDLISFESETNYLIESGVISPKTTFKCVNYIGNVINTLKEKVSNLEDKLYKTNLANFTVALNALDTKLKLEQLTKTPK